MWIETINCYFTVLPKFSSIFESSFSSIHESVTKRNGQLQAKLTTPFPVFHTVLFQTVLNYFKPYSEFSRANQKPFFIKYNTPTAQRFPIGTTRWGMLCWENQRRPGVKQVSGTPLLFVRGNKQGGPNKLNKSFSLGRCPPSPHPLTREPVVYPPW